MESEGGSQTALSFQSKYIQVYHLMGPTLPPTFNTNLALLTYEGLQFVFKYALEDMSEATEAVINNEENQLAKIIMHSE